MCGTLACGGCPDGEVCEAGACIVLVEACDDGEDHDGDDLIDCGDPDCADLVPCVPSNCCSYHPWPGCNDPAIEDCVCDVYPMCCTYNSFATCFSLVEFLGCGSC